MGIFDEIQKAVTKAGDEIRNTDPYRQQEDRGSRGGAQGAQRAPHPGYTRIAAWVKTTYQGKKTGVSDPYQRRLELELMVSEATRDLPAKTRKGFLDYLKSKDYEQLLK